MTINASYQYSWIFSRDPLSIIDTEQKLIADGPSAINFWYRIEIDSGQSVINYPLSIIDSGKKIDSG